MVGAPDFVADSETVAVIPAILQANDGYERLRPCALCADLGLRARLSFKRLIREELRIAALPPDHHLRSEARLQRVTWNDQQ